jgi:hypothetical protein
MERSTQTNIDQANQTDEFFIEIEDKTTQTKHCIFYEVFKETCGLCNHAIKFLLGFLLFLCTIKMGLIIASSIINHDFTKATALPLPPTTTTEAADITMHGD